MLAAMYKTTDPLVLSELALDPVHYLCYLNIAHPLDLPDATRMFVPRPRSSADIRISSTLLPRFNPKIVDYTFIKKFNPNH